MKLTLVLCPVCFAHMVMFVNYNREACMSFPAAKEQVNELLVSVVRFINSCAAEQIRLAPDKCKFL